MAATVVQDEDERVRLAKAFPGFSMFSRFFKAFTVFFYRFSMFLAVHNSSIGDLVTNSLTQSVSHFYF